MTQKKPPEVVNLLQTISKFTKQTDRGSALIAAAWVDDSLGAYLHAKLRPDDNWGNIIFQPDNILGSFSARIKIAYLFNLIGEDTRDDLEIIRKIRNDFAHVRESIKFTDNNIRDKCKNLNGINGFEIGTGIMFKSPKQRFLATAYLLSEYLLSLAKDAKPFDVSYYSYLTTIREQAETAMLNHMAKTLKVELKTDEE